MRQTRTELELLNNKTISVIKKQLQGKVKVIFTRDPRPPAASSSYKNTYTSQHHTKTSVRFLASRKFLICQSAV